MKREGENLELHVIKGLGENLCVFIRRFYFSRHRNLNYFTAQLLFRQFRFGLFRKQDVRAIGLGGGFQHFAVGDTLYEERETSGMQSTESVLRG